MNLHITVKKIASSIAGEEAELCFLKSKVVIGKVVISKVVISKVFISKVFISKIVIIKFVLTIAIVSHVYTEKE